jgi:hypothetical protein
MMFYILLFSIILNFPLPSVHSQNCTYGYFYLTFKQPKATEMVFHRIREFYPNASFYIYTDQGGIDFSYLCANSTLNCKAVMSDIKYGHDFQRGIVYIVLRT